MAMIVCSVRASGLTIQMMTPEGSTTPVHQELYAFPRKCTYKRTMCGIANIAEFEFESNTVQQGASDRPDCIVLPGAASVSL